MKPESTLRALTTTIAVGWLLGLALSWRLWTSSRLFPLAPVSDALPHLDPPLDIIAFAALAGLLFLVAIQPRWRAPLFGALALAATFALLDQTRWQPWVYQYFAMLAACVWLAAESALDACRSIVALTYVWSGLQKVNVTFVRQTWPDFAASLHGLLPALLARPPAFLILMIPAIEVLAGLGLLTRRFRSPAVALALLTHAAILGTLIRSRENTVVWPWNAAMIVFVVVLFWRNSATTARRLLLPRAFCQRAIVVLFGVLPAFSFVGLWDAYLSVALYSGNAHQAVVYLAPATVYTLPAEIRPAIWQQTAPFFLDINRWSYQELNVPAYPEPRVYRVVAERVCQWGDSAEGIKLRILAPPNPWTGARASELYDCRHLGEIH